jgi:hypothetical protein
MLLRWNLWEISMRVWRYIAAAPTTDLNKTYMKEQAKAFLDGGKAPKDFEADAGPQRNEAEFVGWVGQKA